MAEIVQSLEALTYTVIEGSDRFCKVTWVSTYQETATSELVTVTINAIIMTSNKWINATHLCKSYPTTLGKSKQFKNWKKSKKAQAQMQHVKATHNLTECVIKIQEQLPHRARGSYVHPDLIISVVTWCSLNHCKQINKLVEVLYQVSPVTIAPTVLAPISQQALSIQDAINIIAANTIDATTDPKDQNMIMIINTHGIVMEDGSSVATPYSYRVCRIEENSRLDTLAKMDRLHPGYDVELQLETAYAVRAWKTAKRFMVERNQIKMHVGGFIELFVLIEQVTATIHRFHDDRTRNVTNLIRTAALTLGSSSN
ncbi:KilA-N DNA-binding domain-containing protein [uncultured virus]|nr:KilA-N DNA-binding domain-containing protein [uncultured virus]